MAVFSLVTHPPWYTGDPVAYGEWNVTYPQYGPSGWECPRCHFIYGPAKLSCETCNMAQDIKNWQEKDNEDNA